MNAYLIQDEDGYVVVAPTMQRAIEEAENSYIRDVIPDEPDMIEEEERRHWHENCLRGCTLLGEVRIIVAETKP